MRMDKLTSKFQMALSDAQSLAVGRDHQFIEPLHLMLALLDQQGGTARPLLARADDRPVGVAFVAVDREIAMIHAIEVDRAYRRKGGGEILMRGAASFEAEHGAAWLALAVTEANAPARALYGKLGMTVAGRYHYRVAPS